jgi:hypothetical protein
MGDRRLLPTITAAMALGLTPETLRSWRRRGIGPPYVKYVGAYRNRYDRLYWEDKAHGSVFYPEDKLRAFVEALTVEAGRLPRPFPGRLPRSRSGGSGSADGASQPERKAVLQGDLQLLNVTTAAMILGVTPETLRSWRRRGIGPPYIRFPGGHSRRGTRYGERKAHGHIRYPMDGLVAFITGSTLQTGRLPQPVPGRLPGRGGP